MSLLQKYNLHRKCLSVTLSMFVCIHVLFCLFFCLSASLFTIIAVYLFDYYHFCVPRSRLELPFVQRIVGLGGVHNLPGIKIYRRYYISKRILDIQRQIRYLSQCILDIAQDVFTLCTTSVFLSKNRKYTSSKISYFCLKIFLI